MSDQISNNVRKSSNTFVEFNQALMPDFNNNAVQGRKMTFLRLWHGGFCEFICNKLLMDDLLGKGKDNFLKDRVTIESLKEPRVLNSHLLSVYSFFQKVLAIFFSYYPDNVFKHEDQKKLLEKKYTSGSTRKLNPEIFFKTIDQIEVGKTLKLEVFNKSIFGFSGHSLLIKKTEKNEYIFFDPNNGENRGVSNSDLVEKINEQLVTMSATDIFVTKGEDYLNRLRKKKIISL